MRQRQLISSIQVPPKFIRNNAGRLSPGTLLDHLEFYCEQHRVDRPQQANRQEPEACLPSGEVYYLPGKIKISHMRKLQQVARGPSGRTLMHRFMVRRHWRRPGPNWKDQSPRWIEPYWRGPSLASIVEREYRLYP